MLAAQDSTTANRFSVTVLEVTIILALAGYFYFKRKTSKQVSRLL